MVVCCRGGGLRHYARAFAKLQKDPDRANDGLQKHHQGNLSSRDVPDTPMQPSVVITTTIQSDRRDSSNDTQTQQPQSGGKVARLDDMQAESTKLPKKNFHAK